MPNRRGLTDDLREEAELFRLLVESAKDYAIFTMDRDGRVLTWNPGAERLFGYHAAEILGEDVAILFTPEDRERGQPDLEMQTALETGRAEENRWHQRKNGERLWVDGMMMPLKNDAGQARGFAKILRDRTAEKSSADRLHASETRFRLMIESLKGYAIFSLDLEGRISSWNSGAEEVYGYAEAEIVGQDVAVLFTPDDRERGVPERERKAAVAMGEASDVRWHVRKDGSHFFVSGKLTPLLDDVGALQGYTIIAHDITAQKLAEQRLKEADRRKDEFLAILGHELRNPLAAINNAVQLLLPPGREEHLQWSKEVIDRQAKQLGRLIDDLLDIARIAQGKIQLRREPTDLGPIVTGAVETVRPLIEEKRHELSVLNAPSRLRLDADPSKLEQILANLLTNAVKYTDPGGRIRLTTRREGTNAVITVSDTGIGIEPEVLPKVFDLFTQVQEGHDRSQGGLGIGLTVVRSLVEMQGGEVSARSEGRGKGSEFTIKLPVAVATQRPEKKPEGAKTQEARQGRRILVVDDNRDTALGLSKLLTRAGHSVRTAYDGPTAIEMARAETPQTILADIGLPGMDGYQLARTLREELPRGVLLIAVSGYGLEEDLRRSREAGFDRHLVKPVDFDSLLALVGDDE
jgi:PAS domain S-box-containing protein